MKKVFVGLSGGVDSSVAAALLKQQGYDVTGVFMKNWTLPIDANGRVYCPWQEDLAAARAAAAHLGIPLKIYNFEREYYDQVVRYFFREYSSGRTPNPDVMCNREIKFGEFFRKARAEGADHIATGHYVRLRRKSQISNLKSQNCELLRGIDPNKDQSYFLWAINSEALKHSLFPIGDYTKPQVREMAREFGLPNADRKDSQGICFIGPISVQNFLREQLPVSEGVLRSVSGEVLGIHQGTHFMTIGQRRGVGAATGQPVYVADKDSATNTVWVDEDWPGSRLYSRHALVGEINWFNGSGTEPLNCEVQVRYRQKPVNATISSQDSGLEDRLRRAALCALGPVASLHPTCSRKPLRRQSPPRLAPLATRELVVRFHEPVRAVTEGQSLVCYNGDLLLGGGIIVSRLRE